MQPHEPLTSLWLHLCLLNLLWCLVQILSCDLFQLCVQQPQWASHSWFRPLESTLEDIDVKIPPTRCSPKCPSLGISKSYIVSDRPHSEFPTSLGPFHSGQALLTCAVIQPTSLSTWVSILNSLCLWASRLLWDVWFLENVSVTHSAPPPAAARSEP